MMENADALSFTSPRRQAPAGLWIEAYHEIKKAYKLTGLYLLYVLLKSPTHKGWYMLAGLLILLAYAFWGWLRYRNVYFYIDVAKAEFIYRDGVFARNNTVVQIDRIQQVNISRNVVQKLLNVYSLEISTAGSKKTEIKIKALTLEDARALKAALLGHAAEPLHTELSANIMEAHTIRLSNFSVLAIAATSRYGKSFAILFAAASALYNTFHDFSRVEGEGREEAIINRAFEALAGSVWSMAAFIFALWILFNIGTGLIRFYDFTITFVKKAIQAEFGAIKTNQVIIYADKVQIVETISNYLQRKLQLERLIFKQASSEFHGDNTASVEVPGCTPEQAAEILSHFQQKPWQVEKTIRPNYRKVFRPLIIFIVIPGLIAFSFFSPLAYLLPVFAVWSGLIAVLTFFGFRHSKLMMGKDHIIIQEGAWDISVSVMESYKIQGVRVTQRLWHRRAGIAHITIFTAAHNLTFRFAPLAEVRPYLNKWLYDAESSSKNWM